MTHSDEMNALREVLRRCEATVSDLQADCMDYRTKVTTLRTALKELMKWHLAPTQYEDLGLESTGARTSWDIACRAMEDTK